MSPNTYAVIIGIDFYPLPEKANKIKDEPSLKCCVKDARKWESHIKAYLRNRNISDADCSKYITVLTCSVSNHETFQPYVAEEVPKELPLPNAENIIKAIIDTTGKAQKGDTIFIAYSGHGGRDETVVGDWVGKTSVDFGGKDESLIPYDYYLGGLTVRDFVLNYLFKKIVDKGIKLTVFLDSCHSGGATRAAFPKPAEDLPEELSDPPMLVRSIPENLRDADDTPVSAEDYWQNRGPLRDQLVEIKAAWDELMNRTSQSPAGSGVVLRPMEYSLLTGCLAHEYSGENFGAGYLTAAAHDALATLDHAPQPARVTLRQMYRQIFDRAYGQRISNFRAFLQTPLLLGISDRIFPGTGSDNLDMPPPPPGTRPPIPINATMYSSQSRTEFPCLYLRAGIAHGVVLGAEYAVHLWFSNPDRDPVDVRVVVTEVLKTVSRVTLSSSAKLPESWISLAIKQQKLQNARRTSTKTSSGAFFRAIESYPWPAGCVATLISNPATAAKRVRLIGPMPGLSASVYIPGEVPLTFLSETSTETEDFRIVHTANGGYELYGQAGSSLLHASSTLKPCLANAAHVARYANLQALKGSDYASCFELTRDLEHASNDQATGRISIVFDWLRAFKDVPGKRYLNFVVFHFAPDYAIRKIYPVDGAFESVDPGHKRNFSFQPTTGGGILRAAVFWSSTSFDWWEMEALGKSTIDSGEEGAGAAGLGVCEMPIAEVKQVVPPLNKRGKMDCEEIYFEDWCTKELVL